MNQTVPSVLEFLPAKVFVQAQMRILSPEVIAEKITNHWWSDPALKDHFDVLPIDHSWDWNEMEIEYEGRALASEKVGVITGDGEVQGAMLVSTEPVRSIASPSDQVLFCGIALHRPAQSVDPPERWAQVFRGRRPRVAPLGGHA